MKEKKVRKRIVADLLKVSEAVRSIEFDRALVNDTRLGRKQVAALKVGLRMGLAAGCAVADGGLGGVEPEQFALFLVAEAAEKAVEERDGK